MRERFSDAIRKERRPLPLDGLSPILGPSFAPKQPPAPAAGPGVKPR
jgi:hypothetical protein